jgi:RNA polymerase sigma-70 factor (ECF subfamily)
MQNEEIDRTVLEIQLEKHHRESYAWALNCCQRNPDDAQGVLQTVYLKLLEGKARFDGKSAFKTWLFSVIRNTAASRRRRRILHRLKLAGYEQNARRQEVPDERVYRSELQTMFCEALASLPRRQREVLQLVFYHDLTLSEAARVMQVSVGSARTHYERGKKQLRQWMEEAKVMDESGSGTRNNQSSVSQAEAGG